MLGATDEEKQEGETEMEKTRDIIQVKGLKKYFGDVKAVDDISFAVRQGELFGFLGVNGAGKSTTINMLCTLFAPTDGDIEICGYKMKKDAAKIRERIGVVWQNNCLDEKLTVKENLFVRGSLYGQNKAKLKDSVERVCDKLQLEDIYGRRFQKLSGGQKRRCEIAAALLNTPEILFLDEPTTGLDPATRKLVWESLEKLKDEGMTIFLTTHYMEEAARAGHIAVIDKGKIKEYGTPFELKERFAKDKLRLVPKTGERSNLEETLENRGVDFRRKEYGCLVELPDSMASIPILQMTEKYLAGYEMVQGTMDDVFLNITGQISEKN